MLMGVASWLRITYFRFFCLTSQSLTYSKVKGDAPLCVIPAHEMLAVERVDENAFGMKFVSACLPTIYRRLFTCVCSEQQMFQLIQPERILYMQAKNSVEELEWYS